MFYYRLRHLQHDALIYLKSICRLSEGFTAPPNLHKPMVCTVSCQPVADAAKAGRLSKHQSGIARIFQHGIETLQPITPHDGNFLGINHKLITLWGFALLVAGELEHGDRHDLPSNCRSVVLQLTRAGLRFQNARYMRDSLLHVVRLRGRISRPLDQCKIFIQPRSLALL